MLRASVSDDDNNPALSYKVRSKYTNAIEQIKPNKGCKQSLKEICKIYCTSVNKLPRSPNSRISTKPGKQFLTQRSSLANVFNNTQDTMKCRLVEINTLKSRANSKCVKNSTADTENSHHRKMCSKADFANLRKHETKDKPPNKPRIVTAFNLHRRK